MKRILTLTLTLMFVFVSCNSHNTEPVTNNEEVEITDVGVVDSELTDSEDQDDMISGDFGTEDAESSNPSDFEFESEEDSDSEAEQFQSN